MPLSEILNIGVSALFIGLAVLGGLLGFMRGISRQTMKAVTVGVAFMISLLVLPKFYPWLHSFLEGKTLLDITNMLGITLDGKIPAFLAATEGEAAVYIASVPLMAIVLPFGFVALFLSISGILIFPYMIICGVCGFTNYANNIVTRILGAVLGALQGAFIAAVILVPVAGVADVANEAVNVAEEEHAGMNKADEIYDFYHENVDAMYDNPFLKFSDRYLGYIYDRFMIIEVHGEDVDIHQAVDDIVELYVLYGELEGADFKALTPENKIIIDEMINGFGDDRLMTVIVAEAFKAIGTATTNGTAPIEMDEPLNTLMMSMLSTFATADEYNIEGDLHTFASVYFLLSDDGILKSEDITKMFEAFLTLDEKGQSSFKRLCVILEANPRYAGMSETLSEIAMDMLLQNAGVDQDTAETIQEVKGTINEVLSIDKESYETPEEYQEAVSDQISDTLAENNIALEKEQVDKIAEYVIKEKEESGKEEFTDADMADFMAKYYDVYANSGETLPDGIPDGIIPDGTIPEGTIPDGTIPE